VGVVGIEGSKEQSGGVKGTLTTKAVKICKNKAYLDLFRWQQQPTAFPKVESSISQH